jgi:Na+/phosphate symporter
MREATEGKAAQAIHVTGDLSLTVDEIDERLANYLSRLKRAKLTSEEKIENWRVRRSLSGAQLLF